MRPRAWRVEDAEWYAAAVADTEILRWTTERPGTTARDVELAIQALPSDAPSWVAIDDTGERVGNASIVFRKDVAEASYWVAAHARGRGHGTEILRQLTERALAAGAPTVKVVVAAGNHASRRVAEKAGYLEIGVEDHPRLGTSVQYQRRRE